MDRFLIIEDLRRQKKDFLTSHRASVFRIDNSEIQAFKTLMEIRNFAAHGIETSTALGRSAPPD